MSNAGENLEPKVDENLREVALGYHSPTEWVFLPHVIALYDRFVINEDVLEAVRERAKNSPSDYENRKAEILELLVAEGRLKPICYELPNDSHAQLKALVDRFFCEHADDMRRLAVRSYRAFREHELGTVSQLMHPDDPHAQNVLRKAPEWESSEQAIRAGEPLDEVPYLKETMTRYFEDCLFTPLIFPSTNNPMFSWEGYAPFEEWLLARRRDATDAEERIQRGSENTVIEALCECATPFCPIRSRDEASRILTLWDAIAPVRELAVSHNTAIWKQIENAREAAGADRTDEFVEDFERFLQVRADALSREIADVTLETERIKESRTYKLTRFIIATVGSLIPAGGGLQDLLSELHDHLIGRRVQQQFPQALALIEYERNMKNEVLSRSPLKTVCRASGEYKPQQYWDS